MGSVFFGGGYPVFLRNFTYVNAPVMAVEGVTKRTEHHGYSISICLHEQRMVTRK